MGSCRLCDATDLRAIFRVSEWTLERCAACDFVQVREQPTDEELAAQYSEAFFDRGKYEDEFAMRKEYDKRTSLLAETGLRREARVLDAGCATGDFIAHVGDRFDMWGIDISEYAVEEAKKRCPDKSEQLFAGRIEDVDLERGFFDAIVMWDVVEHVFSPVDACQRLVDYLRPGGYLLVSTPDIGAVTARLMKKRWAFMTPPEHLGFFSHRTLTKLLEEKLSLKTTRLFSTGKWVNVGFLFYKLRRVFPRIPRGVVTAIQRSPLGDASVYVPTLDIQYAVAVKPFKS
jgi:2-polyprenyl-3-methyl-5-hydroxy-6-metoxy-1,4-benzoquinol methylase